jgi:hypothetical protein
MNISIIILQNKSFPRYGSDTFLGPRSLDSLAHLRMLSCLSSWCIVSSLTDFRQPSIFLSMLHRADKHSLLLLRGKLEDNGTLLLSRGFARGAVDPYVRQVGDLHFLGVSDVFSTSPFE